MFFNPANLARLFLGVGLILAALVQFGWIADVTFSVITIAWIFLFIAGILFTALAFRLERFLRRRR